MKKIRLHYYKEEPNFGDELSVFVARKLYDDVKDASRYSCNAVFIGSVLNNFFTGVNWLIRGLLLARPYVLVWGAGFSDMPDLNKKKLLRRLDIRACRGYHTLEILKKVRNIKINKNIVIADPGLLAGRLINTSEIKKKYTLGIIPHYVDKNDPLLSNINVKNSILIDIQQSPEEFMKRLTECEYIISSSLHGLIAADSVGIPNIRMVLSDRIKGGDFKYNDYYSAFGLESHAVINLTTGRGFLDADLPDIMESYVIKPNQVSKLQEALLSAFPFV